MALNLIRAGRYDQSPSYFELVSTVRQGYRVTADTTFWMAGVGWWGGKEPGGSTPDVTAAIYADSNRDYEAIGLCTVVSTGTTLNDDGTGGTRYERAITTTYLPGGGSPRSGAKPLAVAGTRYFPSLAVLNGVDTLEGMRHSQGGGTQRVISDFDTQSSADFDPILVGDADGYTVYIYGYENVAPQAPGLVQPSGTEQSLTPQFAAAFYDLNGDYGDTSGDGVDSGDGLYRYQIQVMTGAGTGTTMWDGTFTASTTETNNDLMDRVYSGSTLSRGTTYYWRARHQDFAGAWGPYSSWLSFTISARGTVTLDGAPNGKQLVVAGITFNGKWTSQQSQDTDRVQIRLLAANGSVLQTSPEITKTVVHASPPGTAFTINWADSTFTDLNWNTSYQYQIRGRDTSGQWSNWSNARTFFTNAAPTIPSQLSPANDAVYTSYPLLRCKFSDADDTSAGTLEGLIRITRPDLGTVDVEPTYNSGTDYWEFQTTGTELDEYGTFTWRATAFDGTLFSGGELLEADASWSNAATFQYLAGPGVTITAPDDLDTVATSSMTVTWTATGQVNFRVRLYNVVTGALAYDSGTVVSGTGSHTIPAGSYQNDTDYTVEVSVTDGVPLVGVATITVSISYTPPDDVENVSVTTIGDVVANMAQVSWDPTTYPVDGDPAFAAYSVYRTTVGGPDDGRVRLATITDPNVTSFVDPHPSSGYDHLYEVVQSVTSGTDTIDSEPVGGTVSIALGRFTVLTLLSNPLTYQAFLSNVTEFTGGDQDDQVVYPSLGGGPPVTVYSEAYFETLQLVAQVIAIDSLTAEQAYDGLRALRRQLGTVSMRNGSGDKQFMAITGLGRVKNIGDVSGRWYTVTLDLRQEDVTEGEAAG